MMLANKIAVIYGAGGGVGSTIAQTFAREGARLFLTGRNLAMVQKVADTINAAGGQAEAAEVDALDEKAVSQHLETVINKVGRLDISFNAIGLRNTTLQGVPLADLDIEQFMAPIQSHIAGNFVTGRLAGKHMAKNGSGVIMAITSTPSRMAVPLMGGVAVAMAGVEALIRNLSVEFSQHGVRVLGLRPHGMPDSDTIKEVFGLHAKAYGITNEQFEGVIADKSNRKKLPSLQEMSEVAVFMASDRASAMEGTIVNMSLGSIAD